MPDISMCQNTDCPLCFDCYRYMAKPNGEYQTYADFHPVFVEELGIFQCDYFLTINEESGG